MKRSHLKSVLVIVVAVVLLLPALTGEAWAARKKKDDGAAEDAAKAAAELTKTLEPINKQLDTLMAKLQSRSLFSPQDAGALGKIKYQLLDLIYSHPKDEQMAKPVYQAAVLYSEREEYGDAYELFNYVSDKYPKTPYAQKSKLKAGELQRKLGADYFPAEEASPKPEAVENPKMGKN